MTAPEFLRPERIDTIGGEPRQATIEAQADERAALARRFNLIGVDRLAGDFTLRRDAAGIIVTGRVTAAATQACSITGDPLAARIDEAVDLRFVESGTAGDGEVELDDAGIDVIELNGGMIDLGEVAAETMALALNPFPRGTGAEAALKRAGVLREEQAGPFGGLTALRENLRSN